MDPAAPRKCNCPLGCLASDVKGLLLCAGHDGGAHRAALPSSDKHSAQLFGLREILCPRDGYKALINFMGHSNATALQWEEEAHWEDWEGDEEVRSKFLKIAISLGFRPFPPIELVGLGKE